jgi:hypothetical protein
MKNAADDLTAFKNQIFLYGIVTAMIFEAGSLLFLGFDRGFAYGLALGTAISIVNFNLLAFSLRRALAKGGRVQVFVVYMFRLCLYGLAFYMSARISLASAAGAALGFITLKIAIYYLHGFRAKFSKGRKLRPEPPPEAKPPETLRQSIFGWPDDSEAGDGQAGAAEAGAKTGDGQAGATETDTETGDGRNGAAETDTKARDGQTGGTGAETKTGAADVGTKTGDGQTGGADAGAAGQPPRES